MRNHRHLLLLSICAAAGVQAATPEAGNPSAGTAATSPPPAANVLDRSRTHVQDFTGWLGEEVNSWFGDRPFSEGKGVTGGSMGLRTLWRQDDGVQTHVRIRARFDLPNLRDKAYLFLGRDNERELITDQPEIFSREQQLLQQSRREDQTAFVGLGYALLDHLDFRVGIRGGYKAYTQVRYRQQWMLSAADRAEFRETLFWSVSEGFGSTTTLDYDHAYSPTLALKWRNAATISEKHDRMAWSSSLGVFRTFGDDRILSLDALVNGQSGSKVDVEEYGLRMKWSQPVYRDWLLAELIVGHFWPRHQDDSERDRSWAVGAGLEVRF
jgi:hypothetical protein